MASFERDRPDIEVGSDRRQRRGDDGGIHLLHEERDGEDEGRVSMHGRDSGRSFKLYARI